MAAYATTTGSLTEGGEPERVASAAVTPGLFETLGVPALVGRTFTAADVAVGAAGPVVLGHGLWQRRFGGDPGVVGRAVQLDGRARPVVGVMPAAFQLPLDYRGDRPTELWTVLAWDAAKLGQWGNRSYIGVARLAAGRTAAEATSELAVIAGRWVQAGFVVDQGDGGLQRSAVPVADLVTGSVRGAMALLVAAVLLMLLLASANVAGLVMIGADARRQDMAVRAALGASRGRLVRQLAVEHGVLAMAGGLAGVGIAAAGVRAVVAFRPGEPAAGWRPRARCERWSPSSPSRRRGRRGLRRCCRCCGSRAPAPRVSPTLPAAAPRGPRQRVRQALVVMQVTASVMLLLGATLLARTLVALQRVDLGFAPSTCSPPRCSCRPPPIRPLPTSCASTGRVDRTAGRRCLAWTPPAPSACCLSAARIGDWSIKLEGRPYSPAENPNADFQAVTPGYFQALGLRVRARARLDRGRSRGRPARWRSSTRPWPRATGLARRRSASASSWAPTTSHG